MSFEQPVDGGLWVPETAELAGVGSGSEHEKVLIDNRTDLPDESVRHAVATYFEEHALSHGDPTFQTYATEGSILARTKFTTPANVFEEIKLARELADRDDDIASTIGGMIAVAYRDGMQHAHEDDHDLELWNRIARLGRFDAVLKRLLREWYIAGCVTTVTPFVRESIEIKPEGFSRAVQRAIALPMVGIIPAEYIRVLNDDMFVGAERLAYKPANERIRLWLQTYFNPKITPAKKRELERQQPVWAAMFIAKVKVEDHDDLIGLTDDAYELNPRLVARSKMPASGPYPRPPMTANFALLEAKRLLNIMDYSLLQGGTNFIVIAKKGSDQLPGQPEEIANLRQVIRTASRTGVIVGDHRLNIEIVTPELKELLNPEKRELIGRKLAQRIMRIPPRAVENGGGAEGEKDATEIFSAVVTNDRSDIKRHMENFVYEETKKRNRASLLGRDIAKILHAKIVLQGLQAFTDLVLKLRDRGDIPRSWTVAAGGYDWDAAVAARKREKKDDRTMTPAVVPFTSPNAGPQDNSTGRPPRGTGPDPAKPKTTVTKNRGETVKAYFDDDEAYVIRIGELTEAILGEYPEQTIGRMTPGEQAAVNEHETVQRGPIIAVPVNPGHETFEHRVVRLDGQVSMVVGTTESGAMVAKALTFRDDKYTVAMAENRAIAWGFEIDSKLDEPKPEPPPEPAS